MELIASLLILIAPMLSSAQVVPESKLRLDEERTTQNQTATLQVVAFDGGLPVEGLELSTDFKSGKTDSAGVASFKVRAGDQELYIARMDRKIKYTAVAGEQTQLIVNLMPPEKLESETHNPQVGNEISKLEDARGTSITVRIVADENGRPVAGASVMVSGFAGTIAADANGVASFQLPPGTHALSVFHSGYQTNVRSKLSITSEPANITTRLSPAANDLEEYVVLAPKMQGSLSALVEVRRTSSAVTDVLSSEQMARSGDSDAAASLRRVTGLTLIGGKYVYVRGLGERYSAVTLNGASIPSPEPSRRVVPLDLFPTALLESVIVQKSATANLPGEFGGGLIQLKSKGIPETPFVRVQVSQSFEPGEKGLTYAGGETDWLGLDDGTRELPGSIRSALESGVPIKARGGLDNEGFTPDELAAMARELKPIYNTKKQSDEPVPNFMVSAGRRFGEGKTKFGAAGSILRSSSFGYEDKTSKSVIETNGRTVADSTSTIGESEQEYKTGGALDLGVQIGKGQKLNLGTLLVRHTTNRVETRETLPAAGSGSSNYNRRDSTRLEWVERQLLVRQLSGEHALPGKLQLDWRAQRAEAKRDAPDTREYSFYDRFGFYELDMNSTGNSRTWNELYDVSDELGLSLTAPIKFRGGQAKIQVGANHLERFRESDTFRFTLNNRSTSADFCDVTDRNLETGCFNARHFGSDQFVLINQTLSADSYGGRQTTRAQFVTTNVELGDHWEIQAGMRAEQGRQQVKTYYFSSPDRPSAFAGLKTSDMMPSYNLTWKPTKNWRARLAYSETLTRPEFREMAEVAYIDEETGLEGIGNPKLVGTVIRNYDHRWEYYPSSDESVSLGVFYKEFSNPIEDTLQVQSDGVRRTFENARSATNRGVELESRVALRRASRTLRRFTLANNLTLIDSKVELARQSSIQKSERPLQGQSPWVVNLQLQYDRPQKGTLLSLVYNVVGPRITEVGTFGLPDVYEQPFHQLDLVAQQSLGGGVTMGAVARNLLDYKVESLQGEQTVRSYRRGRSFGVSLSTVF